MIIPGLMNMTRFKLFKSIQWKMVVIYFLLILLAMEVIGVYLLRSLEQYHLNNLSADLDSKAQLLSGFLKRYLDDSSKTKEINNLVKEFSVGKEIKDIYVLDPEGTVISTSEEDTSLLGKKLLTSEVAKAIMGKKGEGERTDPERNARLKHLAYPIKSGDKVVGILYLIASLENIYSTLREVKAILMGGTVLALGITAVLGFALAQTITKPIQEVTSRAASLAKGNFDQQIEVKSKDEIGQLAQMFNYLSLRLKETLGEISYEKSKIEAILSYMADGIVAVNTDGEIIHINPTAVKMLEVSPHAVGKKFAEVFKDVFGDIDFKELVSGDRHATTEHSVKKGDVVLRAHFASFKSQSGETSGVVIVLRDVTEQEKLDRMRKEFVANVSHEIKTPLTTIKSYVETLQEGALNEPEIAKKFLGVIQNETDRMARLIRDLLELSRLDYQKIQWKKEIISLNGIVKDVVSKLGMQIREKELKVSLKLHRDGARVLGDKDRLEQVVLNIVGNAVKYTGRGGSIHIKTAETKELVVFEVKDNGIGIPKEDLPRIFERFYRVDKARSRELGGTGLGLSIAKQIVEAHHGNITVSSKEGKGTIVVITLPKVVNSN